MSQKDKAIGGIRAPPNDPLNGVAHINPRKLPRPSMELSVASHTNPLHKGDTGESPIPCFPGVKRLLRVKPRSLKEKSPNAVEP